MTLASDSCLPESLGTISGTEASGEREAVAAEEAEEALTVAGAGHTAGVKMGNDTNIPVAFHIKP